jgi:integrase
MTTIPPTRLTEAFIHSLSHNGKDYVVRDTRVIGLMVAVNKSSKSYKIQRELWTGQRGRRKLEKTVRHTFGTIEEMTLEEARTRAATMLAQIKRGIDPNAPPVSPDDGAHGWTVERMYQEYAIDLRTRERRERTITDILYRLEQYLPKWKPLRLSEIKRTMAREEHQRITKQHGSRTANMALKDFRTCYNFALKVCDDPDSLPPNPVSAVTFNKERASNRILMPDAMPEWWAKVQAIPNPLRRDMHILGMLSGLRPGTLVSLRREWVDLKGKAICIPRMKSGRSFDLPLSDYMLELVQRIMDTGAVLYPNAPWLFPSRSTKTRDVIVTQVWKEKDLPSETGHILRHTYRTIAQRACVDKIEARLLLDHKVQGIDGVYIHEKALFDKLLATQNQMTAAILELCNADGQKSTTGLKKRVAEG